MLCDADLTFDCDGYAIVSDRHCLIDRVYRAIDLAIRWITLHRTTFEAKKLLKAATSAAFSSAKRCPTVLTLSKIVDSNLLIQNR